MKRYTVVVTLVLLVLCAFALPVHTEAGDVTPLPTEPSPCYYDQCPRWDPYCCTKPTATPRPTPTAPNACPKGLPECDIDDIRGKEERPWPPIPAHVCDKGGGGKFCGER